MEKPEKIVTGKKLRRFVDGAWERISLWSRASDCVMEDKNGNETTVENEIQNIRDSIEDSKTANEDLKKQVLIYNKDTDYYQGYFGGQWKDVVYAGYNWDGYIIRDGIINRNICAGGGFFGNSSYPLIMDDGAKSYPSGVNYSALTASSTNDYNGNKCCRICKGYKSVGSLFTFFPIDLTTFTKLKIEYQYYSLSKKATSGFATIAFVKECGNDYDWRSLGNNGHLRLISTESRTEKELEFSLNRIEGFYYLAIGMYNNTPENATYSNMNELNIYNLSLIR